MRPIAVVRPLGINYFMPAGCLHWPIGEKHKIQQWVDKLKNTPNSFTLLMGDTQDAARTHYRDHIRHYRTDSNSQLALDEHMRRDVRDLAEVLSPIQDKVIGAILGNHRWEFSDGTNSDQYLCQLLKIPYLGPLGVVRLDFRDKGGKGVVRKHLTLFAHHDGGSPGGRTSGADINVLERQEATFDADIYCLSHTHRRGAVKLPKLELSSKGNPRLVERTRVLLRTGAFLKGFGEDHPSVSQPHIPTYAEMKAYRPTDLGFITLKIDVKNELDKGNSSIGYKVEYEISY